METDQQKIVRYLERAEELRKKAERYFDLKTKHALLNEAVGFERMASAIAEKLARKK